MADTKPKKCTVCKQTVNTLSSYAQVALGKHAHLVCVEDAAYNRGYMQGRQDLLAEQEAKKHQDEQEAKEQAAREKLGEEVALRNYAGNLPRCSGCGKKVNEVGRYQTARPIEEVLALGVEVVAPSVGPLARRGVCANCVEVERLARNDARRPQVAAVAPPKEPKVEPEAKQEKKDRFDLIEIDD